MLSNLLNWVKSIGQATQESDEQIVAEEAQLHPFQEFIDHTSNNMFFTLHSQGNDGLLMRTNDTAYDSKTSAKLAIKEMRLAKKFITLKRKLVQEQIQNMKLDYRQHVANTGPTVRGGGKVGSFVRAIDSANRANTRANHSNSLRPYENYIQYIDQILSGIDQAIIQAESKSMTLK